MRRALITAGTAALLVLACLLIIAGGSAISTSEAVVSLPVEPVAELPPQPVIEMPERPSRKVAPAVVAPPPLEPGDLVRVAPRHPLSDLSLALPPKPKPLDQQEGTTLFNLVATAAGRLEGKDAKLRIDGVEIVAPDEMCSVDGRSWPCGTLARAAFRAMLRGRAVNCAIPPDADRAALVARCRIGKQDIGNWLVSNGWARAMPGGPYAEAGKKAATDRKGVFGAGPPIAAPAAPAAQSLLPATSPG